MGARHRQLGYWLDAEPAVSFLDGIDRGFRSLAENCRKDNVISDSYNGRLRVANVIEESKVGGPQLRMVRVAERLKMRVETTLVFPRENSDALRAWCDRLEIPRKMFWMSRITKEWTVALRYLCFSPMEIWRLSRFLKKGHFDLVHASGGSWQIKGVLAAKLAGIPVVWHLNDTSMPWFVRFLFSIVSRYADAYIFASERSLVYYGSNSTTGKPSFVIPAPVGTDSFDPEKEFSGDEDFIPNWDDKFVVGLTANVNPIKGLDTLIRVAAIVNRRRDDVAFVVVGVVYKNQRAYFARLQALCLELGVNNVEFVGGRQDVRPLLSRFDAYLCTSKAESSPIAVWEALSMGKPVISTDVGDVSLYVRDGVNGYIVDVGDSATIARRVLDLRGDGELAHRFGELSRRMAVEKLDTEICARRHRRTYAQVAGADKRGQ